jgi:membrane protease YdiL (CAAX protease family)
MLLLVMTPKQIFLALLSLYAALLLGGSLIQSFSQPQIQGRLELYQTDLMLQASEWKPEEANIETFREQVLGSEPLELALDQYSKARQSALEAVKKPQAASLITPDFIQELTLKQGILETAQGDLATASNHWGELLEPSGNPNVDLTANSKYQLLATGLQGLWSDPPQLLPDTEELLQKNLTGWFRYRSLQRLYQLQQRPEALQKLEAEQQTIAEQSLEKLFVLTGLPILGSLIGMGIILFFLVQAWLNRRASAVPEQAWGGWEVPWNGEMIWQVLVAGFFFIGQIALSQVFALISVPLLPPLFQLLGLSPDRTSLQFQAASVFLFYCLMAISVLSFLYFSIRSYLPLPPGWFRLQWRDNWIGWGIAGYLMALPLVILTSLVNQQIWNGQGGSNPILSLALENHDTIALACFFITAAIAAPLFEEFLFRGFLLASLTRYFPQWGAIALSGLIFSLAHLNLSEVLPLFVLGMVLGYVYERSRNLLAPMLLHSLWNSGTLLGLVILGSGAV